jgi:hypothetical protein
MQKRSIAAQIWVMCLWIMGKEKSVGNTIFPLLCARNPCTKISKQNNKYAKTKCLPVGYVVDGVDDGL